jgi:hypothetical protein
MAEHPDYVPFDLYRADLADFRADLARFREEVRGDLAAMRVELKSDIHAVDSKVEGLRAELHKEIASQTRWLAGLLIVVAGVALAIAKAM